MSTSVLIKFLADTKQAVGEVRKLTREQERLAKSASGAGSDFSNMLGSLAGGLSTFGLAVGGVEKGVRLMKSAFDIAKNTAGLTERQRNALKEIEERTIKTGEAIKTTFGKIVAEMAATMNWFIKGLDQSGAAVRQAMGGKDWMTWKGLKDDSASMLEYWFGAYALEEAQTYTAKWEDPTRQTVTPKEHGGIEAGGDLWRARVAAKAAADKLLLEQFDLWEENNKAEIARRDALLVDEKRRRKEQLAKQKKADAEHLDRLREYDKAWIEYYAWSRAEDIREATEAIEHQVAMAGVQAGNANFAGMYGAGDGPRQRSPREQSADLDREEWEAKVGDSTTAVGMSTAAMQDAYASGISAALEGEAGIAKAMIKGAQMRLKAIAIESGVLAIFWAAAYNWDKAGKYALAAAAAGAGSYALGQVAGAMGGGGSSNGYSGAAAGGGMVSHGSRSGSQENAPINIYIGDGFLGSPDELAAAIDEKLRRGKRSGRIREDSGPVSFRG